MSNRLEFACQWKSRMSCSSSSMSVSPHRSCLRNARGESPSAESLQAGAPRNPLLAGGAKAKAAHKRRERCSFQEVWRDGGVRQEQQRGRRPQPRGRRRPSTRRRQARRRRRGGWRAAAIDTHWHPLLPPPPPPCARRDRPRAASGRAAAVTGPAALHGAPRVAMNAMCLTMVCRGAR